MDSPIVLLAQESVYKTIEDETIASPGIETGGILVGRQVDLGHRTVIVIMGASGPGPTAQRMPLCFSPDYEAQCQALDEWRSRYDRYQVDYIGEWHKHPPEVSRLSAGDVWQTQQILDDPDYDLPGGGVLTLITQLTKQGCQLHVFYITRDLPYPRELKYQIVANQVIEQFLDEYLAVTLVESEAPVQSSEEALSKGSRAGLASRWGELPVKKSHMPQPYVFVPEEGRVLIGDYRVIAGELNHQRNVESDESYESLPDSMVAMRLSRDIRKLERMKDEYGFRLRAPSGNELDHIELTLIDPVPVPFSRANRVKDCSDSSRSSDTPDEGDDPGSWPCPGEMATAIRIIFPCDYPAGDPGVYLCTDRTYYPLNLRILHRQGATSLERMVEVVMRWLLDIHRQKKSLLGLIEENVEFARRQGVRIAQFAVNTVDELATVLESDAEHDSSSL